MIKVTQNQGLSDNIREIGFEVIVSFVERKKKFFDKDNEKFKLFIQELFKYGLEMDEDITDEWATPKAESYFDEDIIMDEKVACSIALLERLLDIFSEEVILPYISEIVLNLLKNTSDFRYKYIALVSISHMVDYVDEIKDVESIIPVLLFSLNIF